MGVMSELGGALPAVLGVALVLGACAPPEAAPLPGALPRADLPIVDLRINMGVSPQVGVVGQPLYYGAKVENGGPEAAPGAVVAFELADGLTFHAPSEGGLSCEDTGSAIECDAGTVAVGQEVFVTFDTTPQAAGTYHTEARVFSRVASDASTGNNLSTLDTEVRDQGDEAYADLALRISSQSGAGRAGRAFPLTFSVSNAGPGAAPDVLLRASFGGPVDVDALGLSDPGCQVATGELLCQLGDIAAGATEQVAVNVLPTGGGTLTVDASAATDLIDDPVPGDNFFSTSYEILDSGPADGVDLGLDLSVSAEAIELEETFVLTVQLANFGQRPASDAAASVQVPDLLDLLTELGEGSACELHGSTLTCRYATLAAGAVKTEALTWRGANAGVATLEGQATSTEEDAWPPDNTDVVEVEVVPPGEVDFTDLSVASAPEPASGVVGDPLILFLSVVNHGPVDATGVVLTDALPPDTEVVSARTDGGEGCALDNNLVSCELGDVPAEATTGAAVIVLPGASGTFSHSVEVTLDQLDAIRSNNQLTQDILIAADGPPRVADLGIEIVSADTEAAVGDPLSFTFDARNDGPDIAAAAALTLDLPGAVTLVSAEVGQGRCESAGGQVSCDLGIFGPGATTRAAFTVLPTSPGTPTFTAEIASLEEDPDQSDDAVSIPVTVSPRPGPQVGVAEGDAALPEAASPGDEGVVMASLRLTAGDAQDIYLSRVTVEASGTGADNLDIRGVKVYLDSDGDGAPDRGASPLAEGSFGQDDGALTLPFAERLTLPRGASVDLLVTYDLEAEIRWTSLPVDPRILLWLLPFIAFAFAPRRRWAPALAAAILLSCGGRSPYDAPTPTPRVYTLTVTGLTAIGAAYEEEASVEGLPVVGATVHLDR